MFQTLLLTAVLGIVVAVLPVMTSSSDAAEIMLGDEEMQNDDLILPRPRSDCPEDDEDECTFDVQNSNKDALIYPITVVTTRRPHLPPSRLQALTDSAVQATPPGPSDDSTLCDPDDEDCSDTSSGAEPTSLPLDNSLVTPLPSGGLPGGPLPTPTTPADWLAWLASSSTEVASVAAVPESKDDGSARERKGQEVDVGGLPRAVLEVSLAPTIRTATGYGVAATSGRLTSGSSISHRDANGTWPLAAISMNIILIVGIAAGIVVLLLILIFAVCAYSRQRTAGPSSATGSRRAKNAASAGHKAVDTKGYAYEACSTSPPMAMAQPPPPLVVNATYQTAVGGYGPPYVGGPMAASPAGGAYPPYGMQHQMQPMIPSINSGLVGLGADGKAAAAKKDVKEWYV